MVLLAIVGALTGNWPRHHGDTRPDESGAVTTVDVQGVPMPPELRSKLKRDIQQHPELKDALIQDYRRKGCDTQGF